MREIESRPADPDVSASSASRPPAADLPVGGGGMGARIGALDWSRTPLGAQENWPQSLRTTVRIMLTSRFAMWMAWGAELTFFCNDAYLPTTGVKRDWVLGARSDRVWAEIWPDIGPRIQHVLATGEATWDEQLLLYLERSGFVEETYHTFSYSPLSDDRGATVGMLCVVAEVSERVIGERQLATLRDLGARLSAASTRAKVMAALESCLAAEPRDLPFALVYLADGGGDRAKLAAAHGLDRTHAAAPAEIGLHDGATAWPLADALAPGQKTPGQAVLFPIHHVEGAAPLGFLVAGLNPHRAWDGGYRGFLELVTGQLAAALGRADEFERERARAEALAEIDRAKTAFFSNVSHEFRTPLTLMLGPLDDALAEAGGLPPEQVARIEVAHRNGLRLLRLVNTLLDFSRIEAGRVEASYAPVDLGRLTSGLASTFRSAFDRAGLAFAVDFEELPEPAYVDRDMWEKIVLNLLSNAFKFTLSGGVTLRLGAAAGDAVLTVADTGVGVPAAELPKLFDRFHRVEGSRGRSFEGSGIGLALVQELVGLHGGSISADSKEGEGTTFRVTIPLGSAHLPADRIVASQVGATTAIGARAFVDEALRWIPSDPAFEDVIDDVDRKTLGAAAGEAGRVLFADDNADLRDYVRRLLEGRGYRVESVADGRSALAAARRNRPDLLLTDVMMPEMDGFALLAAIRADAALAELPVVMLSARAGADAQVEGLDAGADDYLAKPFSARELLARVSANLDMARVRRQAAETVRASEARLSIEREFLASVLAKAPIAISIADAEGRDLILNERGVDLLGRRHVASGAGGAADGTAIHPDGRPYAPEEHPTVRAARGEHIEAERMIYLRGGAGSTDRIILEVDAVPIRDDEGRLAGAVTVFEDAGARERADEALHRRVDEAVADREQALAQLHEIAKFETIGQLTGGVAHDFNNLLTPIMGSLELLQRRLDGDARATRYVNTAMQAAERSRTLIQRLLAFARRQNLEARPVDVAGLIVGMRDFVQRTIGVGINLAIDVAPGLPSATVDPNQLELALLNLCVNARDAMADDGTITLTADVRKPGPAAPPGLAPGCYVRISVIDTGSGMDEATMARAIEPFFTTKPQGHGTGLGLSMVHGLAAQSGGAFKLSSKPGLGTTGTLWLPVADETAGLVGAAEADAGADSDTAAAVRRETGARVLVVDDEEIVRDTTAEMLREAGYVVAEARSAAEAIGYARSGNTPDVVVTDYKMPGMSGVELARVLRQLRPHLPVLLITGFATVGEEESAGLPRLAKPFRQGELAARVGELFEGSRAPVSSEVAR